MSEREYKFDAFISYRHCELDKYVAENLHRVLETYDLPKQIKEKLNVKGKAFKRIFRDEEELPLSSNLEDPIIDALKDSKYLIVICSPRLKDSLWCKKEIETFKKLRGRKNIFCVLIEGEPSDSFPEEVLYDEEVVNGKTKRIPVEPLAADVRGETKKEVLKKIKEEKLRLVAPMYNLDYDDLKQRHKLRRQKQIFTIVSAVAIASFLFALYTSFMLIKITNQQNTLKLHQASSLSTQSINYLNEDNRYKAIESAYQALTKFGGVKMPYTSDAEYALLESLGVYDAGYSYKAITEIQTDGVIKYVKTSSKNSYSAIYDESDVITLFDSNSLKVIAKYNVSGSHVYENSFTFIGDDKFVYIDGDSSIKIVNASDNKIIKEIAKENNSSYVGVVGSEDGLLTYANDEKVFIYNINEDKLNGTLEFKDRVTRYYYYSEDNKYVFVLSSRKALDFETKDYFDVHVLNTSDAKEINHHKFDYGYINGVRFKGDVAYLLFNEIKNNKYITHTISYSYKEDKVNFETVYHDTWGTFITRSYPEGTNHVVVTTYDTVNVLDGSTGKQLQTYHPKSEVIGIYSHYNSEYYLSFVAGGTVHYIDPSRNNSVEYGGRFILNLPEYSMVSMTPKGYLMVPLNGNRIILYEQKKNDNVEHLDGKPETNYNTDNPIVEYDNLKEEYKVNNKSLVKHMIYDDNREHLFVYYVNHEVAIYDTNSKNLINIVKDINSVDTYFGKDKYGRTYIGTLTDAYILDKDYNKVGHIKSLTKVDGDRLVVTDGYEYYSIKIYTLNDLLKEAKEYLDLKK